MRVIILLSLLGLGFISASAQEISFSYTSPQNLTVCGSDQILLSFKNNSFVEINNVKLKIKLPSGVSYKIGSVANALEFNILNLNLPEFSIPSIPAQEMETISLTISADCEAFESANMANNFDNYFWISYLQKVDSLRSTPPYAILTPFLILDQIPDIVAPLSSRPKRIIKITNTRLGVCKNFILLDRHGAAKISSVDGKTLVQNDTILELFLSGKDFMNIGDKDSLFERDESIWIEEEIEAINCSPYQIASEVSVKWGCDSLYCQENNESSIVIFEKSNLKANLNFSPIVNTPSCICSKDGANQGLIIKNIGDGIADSVCVKLNVQPIGLPDPIGIRNYSIDISNNHAVYSLKYLDRIPNCYASTGDTIFSSAEICFSELNIDEEIHIAFNWLTCLTTIDSTKPLSWFYSYSYQTKCVENSQRLAELIEVKMEKIVQPEIQLSAKLKDNVTSIDDMKVYFLQNSIGFSKALTNEIFTLTIVLPCPLSVIDTSFVLDGKKPIAKNVIKTKEGITILNLSYKAPFTTTQLFQEIALFNNCEDSCALSFPNGTKTKIVSSCSTPVLKAQTLTGLICLKASLTCKDEDGACGNQSNTQFDVAIRCDSVLKRSDTIPGYLKYEAIGQRISYGSRDDLDDRMFHSGSLDTSKIIKTNFITGDSLLFNFRSVICSDDTSRTYDSVAFVIAHQLTFANLSATFHYYEASSHKYYTTLIPNLRKFIQKAPGLKCGETGLSSSGLGNGNSLELNIEMLHMLFPELPQNHRLANGDSFNISISGKVISTVNDRLVNIDIIYYAFLFDKKGGFLLPFQCGSSNQKFKQVTNNKRIEFRQSETFICKRNFALPSVFIYGSKNLHNFFPNEFRSLNKIADLRYIASSPLSLDSIQFNISYTNNGVSKLADRKVFILKQDQNNWYVDSSDLQSLRYDESYTMEILVYGSVEDCKKIANVKDLSAILSMKWSKDFDAGFHIDPNFVDILQEYQFSKYFSIKNYFGNESIHVINKSIVSSSKIIQWSASINSVKFPGYFLLRFSSARGLIDSFELKLTGTIPNFVALDSSKILLGPIDPNVNYILNFCAKNSSCDVDTIILQSIWSCGYDFNFGDSCSTGEFKIPVANLPPQLELIVTQESKEIQLCDTLPELFIELYNGGEGYAYHPQLFVDIPAGVEFIPSSLVYAYPSSATFQPLPAPVFFGGNTYVWNFEQFIPEIQKNGLPGYTSFPDNGILLKCKAKTACNSTVNGFFSFKIQGENNCALMSNSIRKSGALLKVKGITQKVNTSLQINLDSEPGCQDELLFKVSWKTDADSTFNDTLRILLPDGIDYVDGSMVSINGLVFGQAIRRSILGYRYLMLPIPKEIPFNEVVGFTFKLKNFQNNGCKDYSIPVDITSSVISYCSETNKPCTAFVVKAEASVVFKKQTPAVKLLDFSILNIQGKLYYTALLNVQHWNDHVDSLLSIALYQDNKNYNVLDQMDRRLKVLNILYDSIGRDGNVRINIPLEAIVIDQCRYISVLENNCLCVSDTIYWKNVKTDSFSFNQNVCHQAIQKIGVDKKEGHFYSWNVSCDNCPFIEVKNTNTTNLDTKVQYILVDSTEDDCRMVYIYNLNFKPAVIGLKNCQIICRNDSVILHSGGRMNFEWRGSFLNPKDSIQKIGKLLADTIILLDFLDENACSGTDTFCIQISRNLDEVRISPDTTIHFQDEVVLEITKGFTYKWMPEKYLDCYNCYLVHSKPDSNISYVVEVKDSLGCVRILKVSIKILFPECDSSTYFIPNAFSPNQDQVNDIFYVRANNVEKVFLVIYDRWGEKLFESRDLKVGWDGTYKGISLPPDVYAYYCELYCIGGKKIIHKGNVSLLK